MSEEAEVIALATLFQDGASARGKIPVSLVKALKAQGGDVLAFERRSDGAVVMRKSTASERKAGNKGGKK